MYSFHEQDYKINDIKSWIHCLIACHDTPFDAQNVSYHYHDYIEFLYALSSDASVWIDGDCHHFETGDLAIINSERSHTVTTNKKSRYICVKFSPNILYANDQALFEYKYVMPFLSENQNKIIYHNEEFQNINISALMNEIIHEWNKKKPAYELIIRANILKIFSEIIRKQCGNKLSEVIPSRRVKMAITYIHENLHNATENEAAELCGLSYNYFARVFKKTLGKSFNCYLTQAKLHEAKNLLITTNKSITEIAYELGFSSASHFIMRFKEENKMTPNEFRNKIKKV